MDHLTFGMRSSNSFGSNAIIKTYVVPIYPLIQLSIIPMMMLTVVIFFRMAPATRQNPNRDGEEEHPPPPPPPPEAWQALMAATNANTHMLLQMLQGNQRNLGNQNQGNF
jgi:hypothetical protein